MVSQGDLAKREIYPALWYLYRDNRLPLDTKVFGYARSQMTIDKLRQNVAPFVKVEPEEQQLYDQFWQIHTYVSGHDGPVKGYNELNRIIDQFEQNGRGNRVFYMSLPPSTFKESSVQIKRTCMAKR